jgi:pimeloyl-ACP methyl ester carboxylesterase
MLDTLTFDGQVKENNMNTVTSKDGTKIAYDVYGQGPAVILVDGASATRSFGGSSALAQSLATAGFTTYVYDRRGRGESGDAQPPAVQREVEDIEALIDQAGGTAHLYGISSGGALALEAAAALGKKVNKLAVYEVPYVGVESAANVPASEKFTELKQLVKDGKNGDAFVSYMGNFLPKDMLEGMRQAPFWPMMEAVAPSLVYDATVMFGRNFTPQKALLEKIAVTVLALSGDVSMPGGSTAYMPKAAQAIANMVQNGKYQLLTGQSHDVNNEVIAPVLAKFYSS